MYQKYITNNCAHHVLTENQELNNVTKSWSSKVLVL